MTTFYDGSANTASQQHYTCIWECKVKVKVITQHADVAQGVPGRLRPRVFLTFGTTRVVGYQPYALAAFTPVEIPVTHIQRLSRPQGAWFRRGEKRKKKPQGHDRESNLGEFRFEYPLSWSILLSFWSQIPV
jgi:hypothetical protein